MVHLIPALRYGISVNAVTITKEVSVTMILFPQRLRQLRDQNGTMQSTLAGSIHRSPASISNYENSLYEPNLETLTLIADFYRVSVDYLLGRTDFPSMPDCLTKVIYGEYTVGRFLNLLKRLPKSDRKFLVQCLCLMESARFPKDE